MLSNTSSSTNCSASRCKVQRARPCGGGEQAKAMSFASRSPSNAGGRVRHGRFASNACSSPSSTNALRTRSTVGRLTCTAAATAVSEGGRRSASAPSSHASRMRACASLRAADFPLEISASSSLRSASVSVTLYFFVGIGFSSLVRVSELRLETLHQFPSELHYPTTSGGSQVTVGDCGTCQRVSGTRRGNCDAPVAARLTKSGNRSIL